MNIKKLYFGLVSLISIIAIAISLGIILSNLGKLVLISDEEYLDNNYYWTSPNCKIKAQEEICGMPIYNKSNPAYYKYQTCIANIINNSKFKEAIKKCEEKEKKKILLRRYYNLKINLIGSISTFIVFLILFIFHYYKFKKLD